MVSEQPMWPQQYILIFIFFYLIEYFEAIEKLQLQDVTEHFMHE